MARMMVLVAVVGRVVVEAAVEVGGGNLRGRAQVAKVVHPLKRAKRRLEMWRVGTGLGIVVNPVMQAVRRFAYFGCLSNHPGMWSFLPEFALNTDNPIVGRLLHQPSSKIDRN